MLSTVLRFAAPVLCGVALTTGCSAPRQVQTEYPMGEKAHVGPLTYTVVETAWKTQLGQTLNIRVPQRRFFLVTVSVTNGGGKEVSIPLLELEDANGKAYPESENGAGVDNWFGLLRTINPAETQQGRLLFDVPLTSFRLRVTDAGEPGSERYAWVQIPLHMDIEQPVGPDLGAGISK
jgi:Domain of unknown function (DUF4352)